MEHLETQVSDLRSFLPGALSLAASTSTSNANSRPAAHMAGVVIGPGASTAATTPRHPSQSAGSSVSAVGSNSAHPSPLAFVPNHNAQPARNHGPSVSTTGPVSAHHSTTNGGGGGGGRAGSSGVAVTAGVKRKLNDNASDDSSQQRQQRSKRNRYISIACNECKRRKIKCNGETPCYRCGNLSLACQYAPNCCSNNFKDSDDWKEMKDNFAKLQEQFDTLFQSINAFKQENLLLAPIQDRALPFPNSAAVTPSPSTATMSSVHRQDLPPPPRAPHLFRGPTSASFTVDLAKSSLRQMKERGHLPTLDLAAAEGVEDNVITIEDSPAPSPYQHWPLAAEMPRARPRDPLWDFDRSEMVRLCRLHEEEVGIMYPVVNINNVVSHANFLADWLEASSKHGFAPQGIGQDEGINNIRTLELKIIMCCALVVEGQGYSLKGLRLWESMQPTVDRMLMSERSKITNLPFLALVGGYRFLSNEETLAWRVMGQVTRLCFELGIHRRDVIDAMENEQDRKNAINTFWSAYVLDRRWSFGVGLPFVVHDDKIDPKLPYPDDYPYLKSMITFSRVCAKVWKLVDFFDPIVMREMQRSEFEQLDREILDWYDSVPEEIKIDELTTQIPIPGTSTYDTDRLQIWTRLRRNQIRIWLYTPILHSSHSIEKNLDLAQRVIDLSKETIQCLSLLNTHTDVYRRIQVFYNHFLTSAIACLFLASAHRPGDLSAKCRDAFNMSMVLVEDISSKSHVSQRLWQTIDDIKAYAPVLGLADKSDDRRVRQNAALAMAGMARMSRGGQPPFEVLSTSDRHGSISSASAGHQASPSPGIIPGFGGSNQPPSRMGSLTPHAGGASPHNGAAGGAQGHGARPQGSEDVKNGLRLRTEMSRMYEALSNGVGHGVQLNGSDDFFASSPNEYSDGEQFMRNSDHGVYQRLKKMF